MQIIITYTGILEILYLSIGIYLSYYLGQSYRLQVLYPERLRIQYTSQVIFQSRIRFRCLVSQITNISTVSSRKVDISVDIIVLVDSNISKTQPREVNPLEILVSIVLDTVIVDILSNSKLIVVIDLNLNISITELVKLNQLASIFYRFILGSILLPLRFSTLENSREGIRSQSLPVT